jgi:hypothetical protein
MRRLSFDDLSLFNAAFEIRFDDAPRIWDRSGELWNATLKEFPNLKRQHVEPNRVAYASTTKPEVELTAELSRLGFVEHEPDRQLKQFSRGVEVFAGIAVSLLGIERYQRTGLRLMFRKDFPKAEEAADSLSSTGIQQKLSSHEKLFGISGPTIPELAFRREDGKNGFSLRLKVETQKVEISAVPGWSTLSLPISSTRHWVSLDVDCYIQASVSADAIVFSEWILQTAHIIRRDCDQFLNGL